MWGPTLARTTPDGGCHGTYLHAKPQGKCRQSLSACYLSFFSLFSCLDWHKRAELVAAEPLGADAAGRVACDIHGCPGTQKKKEKKREFDCRPPQSGGGQTHVWLKMKRAKSMKPPIRQRRRMGTYIHNTRFDCNQNNSNNNNNKKQKEWEK
jgi:hypothetical protein